MVRATEPSTIQSKILKAGGLTDDTMRNGLLKSSSEKRKESDKTARSNNKRARTRKGFMATDSGKNKYKGLHPKFAKCSYHHQEITPYRTCFNYNQPGHVLQDCRALAKRVTPVNAVNSGGVHAFALGTNEAIQDSNIMTEKVYHKRIICIPLPNGDVLKVHGERSEGNLKHLAEEVRFLGHVLNKEGYYRCFIENFSRITQPLTLLTQKDKKFDWGEEHEKSFQTLKDAMCSDASGKGLGCVLMQRSKILEAQKETFKEVNMQGEALRGLDKQIDRKEDDAMYFVGRIWIPLVGNLRTLVMDKAHKSRYSIHPRANKMYHDLRDVYWWPGIKKDLAIYVSKALGTRLDMSTAYPSQTDGQSERTIQTLEDMLRACVIDFGRSWDTHLPLAELFYNNSYHTSIKCALFEALCERKYRSPIVWAEVGESKMIGPEINGVVRFEKKGKLAPIFVGSFKIIEWVSLVACRLKLPQELNGIHDAFHVSNLKNYIADETLHVSLDEIKMDDKLHFVEEPVEIMDREVKKLKRCRIPIVKVRWNSKRGPEFTWERENHMKLKKNHFTSETATEMLLTMSYVKVIPSSHKTHRSRIVGCSMEQYSLPALRKANFYVGQTNSTILTFDMTKERIRKLFSNVEISVSSYDTAWVAMVPSPNSPKSPRFPECLNWLMDNQLNDGSWGLLNHNPHLLKDTLSSTLACIVALKRWNVGEDCINKAMDKNLASPLGFDVIFPSMLEYAKNLNINLPVKESDLGSMLHEREREIMRCHSNEKEAYMAYILEGLGNSYDLEMLMKYQMKNGSVLNSPSATAAALTRNQNAGCLHYLTSLLEKFGDADLLAEITKEWDYMNLLKEPLKDVNAALEVYPTSQIINQEELSFEEQNLRAANILKRKASTPNSSNISNEDYLKFVVEDFNTRQSNFREELKGLERWMVENRFDQLKFDARISYGKSCIFTIVFDDFFDAGGSVVELVNLIHCVEKWNINVDTDCCSEEVRILFLALKAEVFWTRDKAFKLQARYITSDVIESWLHVTKAMLREHIWARDSYVPTLDEFVENGHVARDIKEGRLNVLTLHENYGKSGIEEDEVAKEIEMLIDDQKKRLMQLVLEPSECIVLRACKDAFWKMFNLVSLFYAIDDGVTGSNDVRDIVKQMIYEPVSR
nr:ent-kaur-16-ene synthase, chloroplastic-like [Tanacetum cinerariifolium]